MPGGTYHVMARGVAYLPIYRDSFDRRVFLTMVDDVVMRHGWLCFAYCLMTTHYHLLVRTPNGDVARGMQRLNGNYARSFNRRHGGRGHAFESRYGSVLVETEAHLLGVVRYLALNPVLAGIVADPAAWPWSSYRFLLGHGRPPRFLAARWILELFAPDRERARERLARFVAEGLERPHDLEPPPRLERPPGRERPQPVARAEATPSRPPGAPAPGA